MTVLMNSVPVLSVISTIVFVVLIIVKKEKMFLWGIFGSLGPGILSIISSAGLQIMLFFVTGMLRSMLPALADNVLEVKSYTYKTIIENRPGYNHMDTRVEENICEFSYGFMKNPHPVKAAAGNELTVREGPPFTFLLDFNNLSHTITSVYIKNAEIISNNGTRDLFSRGTVDIEIYNIFWDMPTRKRSFLKKFLKERTLHIGSLYEPMRKTAVKQKRYTSKEELENGIHNARTDLRLYFQHAPIDVSADDTIKINIEILFYENGGEAKKVTIHNTYFRECFEETAGSLTPLEKLPAEDEVELFKKRGFAGL
jgi:hypothetical protein